MIKKILSKPKIGVLLVNLGTPDTPKPKDVFRYLNEFLTDNRVLDFGWFKRQFLARGVIVPFRYKQSSKLYHQLWTEKGSPLLVHSLAVENGLQQKLGENFKVSLAMRYQNPSITAGLKQLKDEEVGEIVVLPLFPQYASATTGSVHQKVMEEVKNWESIPKMTFINNYCDHPAFINALYERAKQYSISSYDHILISFHGLPERQICKADVANQCLKPNCCLSRTVSNQFCYKAQCFATARALVNKLGLREKEYTICFQSRLGKDSWIQPYTSDTLQMCVNNGWKKLLVFCPSFVSDCLETISEITHEYGDEFKKLGGEHLQLVEGLNDHPVWIEGLSVIVQQHTSST